MPNSLAYWKQTSHDVYLANITKGRLQTKTNLRIKISDKSLTQRFDVAMTLLPSGKLKELKCDVIYLEWQNKQRRKVTGLQV